MDDKANAEDILQSELDRLNKHLEPILEIFSDKDLNIFAHWQYIPHLNSIIAQKILEQQKYLIQRMGKNVEANRQHSETMIKQSNAMTKQSNRMLFLTVVILAATITQVCVAIWK